MDTPQPLPQHPRWMKPNELSAWVQRCVDCQVPESVVLDYKRRAYRLSEAEAQAELAKDITSFANHQGGALLVGIGEKRHPTNSKLLIPGPDYGIERDTGFEMQARDILASHVSPMLPDLEIVWVPREGDDSRGVYLIWHPESWLAPHMVHGYDEFRYFWRDAASSRPVPITEQQVDRLYQRRISGEQRAEAFLRDTDFSIGHRDRDGESEFAYMTVCICPRLLLDFALDFSDVTLQSWLESNHFGIFGAREPWKPASWGAFLVCEKENKFKHTAQLYSNGSLAVSVRVARHFTGREEEKGVSFSEIENYVRAAYKYVAKLYSHIGLDYLQLRVRVTFDHLAGCWLEYPSQPGFGKVEYVTVAGHILNEGLNVATMIADPKQAMKPMLDQIWRTFELGWQVRPEVAQHMEIE